MNDDLDALLKDDGHLDDDGFTARVVSHLPKKRRRFTKREGVIVAFTAAAGAAGFAWLSGIDVEATVSGLGASWLGIAAGALVIGVTMWGVFSAASSEG